MITIKGYQLPYNYKNIDRFYNKNGVVNLPTPIFTHSFNLQNNEQPNFSFNPITFKTAYLNTEIPINFNYISVEGLVHNDKNIHYWFITDTEKIIISSGVYTHTLMLDIITTYELFKNTTNLKFSIERKLYNNFEKTENNKLVLKDERNPNVWSNNEFSALIPQNKKIEPISLSPLLIKTEKYFENGRAIWKVPENYKDVEIKFTVSWYDYFYDDSAVEIRPNGTTGWTNYSIKLSPVISILLNILRTTNFNDSESELSTIATIAEPYVNSELNIYHATTLAPVVYNMEIIPNFVSMGQLTPISGNNNDGNFVDVEATEKADNDEFVAKLNSLIKGGGSYTCEWGHTINYDNEGFVLFLRRLLFSFYNNQISLLRANPYLVNFNSATHWLIDLPTLENDGNISVNRLFPSFKSNLVLVDNNYQNNSTVMQGLHFLPIDLDRNVNKDKKIIPIKNKIELPISSSLFTDWESYKYLNTPIFNSFYNPIYIDIIGNELPLENSNIFKNGNIYLETWLGTGEQNISYYSGKLDENNNILQPRYVSKFAFAEPVEFTKDVSQINYQLKDNYWTGKNAEVFASNISTNKQISASLNSKITANNSGTIIRSGLEIEKTDISHLANTESLKSRGVFDTVKSTLIGAGAGAIKGGAKGGVMGGSLGALSGIAYGLFDIGKQKRQIDISTKSAKRLAGATNLSNEALNTITNQALIDEANATMDRNTENARIKKMLIESEIADIHNLPNTLQNQSLITKMLSMEKPQTAIIELFLNEKQQKAMWNYFNLNGVSNWGLFEISTDWWKQFTLFDYFKGGDWTKYLNSIGIYNIEIIKEFNSLMMNGLRLHHRNYQLNNMSSIFDISTQTPNWKKDLVETILPQ